MEFTFSKRAKSISMILMVIGLLSLVVGALTDPTDHHQKTWANLLVNGFFFFGISLGALFFYALQYATETAWSVMVKRVFEGIMSYLPVGAITIFIVLVAGSFGLHHIYHWMDPEYWILRTWSTMTRSLLIRVLFWTYPSFGCELLSIWEHSYCSLGILEKCLWSKIKRLTYPCISRTIAARHSSWFSSPYCLRSWLGIG